MIWGKLALFAGGMLFGSAGMKILSSKDAKKAYAHTAAAVLRMKDAVMATVTSVRESADDVLADAKAINEARNAKADEIIEDESCCECCCEEETNNEE